MDRTVIVLPRVDLSVAKKFHLNGIWLNKSFKVSNNLFEKEVRNVYFGLDLESKLSWNSNQSKSFHS